MDAAAVGRTVQWARKRAGMTQHELANALGMPQPSIARMERGAVIPRTSTLIALLTATGHRLAVEPIGPAVDPEGVRRRLALPIPKRTWRSIGKTAGNARTSPIRILRRLRRFSVPFVLIGDLAEAAHGSPVQAGRVVEVVHARSDAAQERLALALDDLAATSAGAAEYKTDAGHLRLTNETAAGDDYELLIRTANPMTIDAGLQVPVAAIEDLIRSRLARCTPMDRMAAAELRAIADFTGD